MDACIRSTGFRRWLAALACALAAPLFITSPAIAGVDGQCPPIADKPNAIDHVDYTGVQHITYCYGPVQIQPGQNTIRFNLTGLKPSVPGYITRFDPEFVYTDGSVPGVDVLHLHHAVWLVGQGLQNLNPQFAAGEEKTISQLPSGFGWRSNPGDLWILNDMLHDLVAKSALVYVVWRIDFVPDTSPAAATIKPVTTKWMDVAGLSAYPVFDATRGMGAGGRYTFPDQATGAERAKIGTAATWTPNHDVTLIGTAGHLHPGGLNTQLKVSRGAQTNTLFTSNAKYYEPAGAVSWDVAMGGTPSNWRVQLQAGDKLSVHATYDTQSADWYEGMGIMPVAVYDGNDVGGFDAMNGSIPQNEVLSHSHLAENDNHGGGATGAPDPLEIPGVPAPGNGIQIKGFAYLGDVDGGWSVPTVVAGQTLNFSNIDALGGEPYHTVTSCRAPCTGKSGIAYPVANGPTSFDSGQLGSSTPAVGRLSWKTPGDLKPGTYTYFCRIHPFMRGKFRVADSVSCHGKTATQIGTEGPDVLRGTKGRDVIVGLGGNDKIIGLGGNDFICGAQGKDKLMGGRGKDRLFGGAGKDRLIGGPGTDRMSGGPGKDRLSGVAGKDRAKQ